MVDPTDERVSGFVFRSKRIWIPGTAIASRFFASAPAASRRTWCYPTAAWGRCSERRGRTGSLGATADDQRGLRGRHHRPREPRAFAIGDTLHSGMPLQFPDLPASRRNISGVFSCGAPATSSSMRASGSSKKRG